MNNIKSNFKIGDKVNHISGKFMRNGIITGLDAQHNRVFVKWPIHGASSIPQDNLILS